ncbi:MAG: hypothetical protein ACOYXT_00490 [Bacteroidota bacterium]
MKNIFNWVQVKDCRRFSKRCYTLPKKADDGLYLLLQDFGEPEIFPFSKFSPVSNDAFRIRFVDVFEIAGTFNDYQLYITVSKSNTELWPEIEDRISLWVSR